MLYKRKWILSMIVCICYIYICKKEGSFFNSWLTWHIYCVVFRVSSSIVVSNSTLIIPAVVFRQVMKRQNLCSLIPPSTIMIPIVRLAYRVTACGTKKLKGFVFYRWWIRNYCHIIRSIYNQQEDDCLRKIDRIDTQYMYKKSKCYIKKLSLDFFQNVYTQYIHTFYFDIYQSTVIVSIRLDIICCITMKSGSSSIVVSFRSKQSVSFCVSLSISFSVPAVGTLWLTVSLTGDVVYRLSASFCEKRVVTWSNCDNSGWVWKNSFMLYSKPIFVRYTKFEENLTKFWLLWQTDLLLCIF